MNNVELRQRLTELHAEGKSRQEAMKILGITNTNQMSGQSNHAGIKWGRGKKPTPGPKAKTGVNVEKLQLVRAKSKKRIPQAESEKPKVLVEPAKPPPPSSVAEIPSDQSERRTLLELESGMCRWPCGESDAGQLYCGNDVVAGSYCAGHARVAYQPVARRDRTPYFRS